MKNVIKVKYEDIGSSGAKNKAFFDGFKAHVDAIATSTTHTMAEKFSEAGFGGIKLVAEWNKSESAIAFKVDSTNCPKALEVDSKFKQFCGDNLDMLWNTSLMKQYLGKYFEPYKQILEETNLVCRNGNIDKSCQAVTFECFQKDSSWSAYHSAEIYEPSFSTTQAFKYKSKAVRGGNEMNMTKLLTIAQCKAELYFEQVLNTYVTLAKFLDGVDMSVLGNNAIQYKDFTAKAQSYGVKQYHVNDVLGFHVTDTEVLNEVLDVLIKHNQVKQS